MTEAYDRLRRHPRVEALVDIRISTIDPERDPWTGRPFFRASHETCANVSCGGAFVRTSEPLRPGRRVLVELLLPSGQSVEALGRVAWSRQTMAPAERESEVGIGIEFMGGSPGQFAALETFIAREAQRRDVSDPTRAKGGSERWPRA